LSPAGAALRVRRLPGLFKKRCRISLHAIAATQHYAEPQQGTAKESEAGGLRD